MNRVLIVGAGPTGLVMAIELEKRGIPFRIIESRTAPSLQSKALAIQPRTLEVFERMGLIDQFLKEGRQIKAVCYSGKTQQTLLELEGIDTEYPFILALPQSQTEQILIDYLQSKGIAIEWETTLTELHGTLAHIQTASKKKESVDVNWVLGCDGAHSTVRQQLHLSFEGSTLPETFLLADITMEGGDESCVHVFFNQNGFGVILPLPQNKAYRVIFPVADIQNETDPLQQVKELLKERGAPEQFKPLECLWLSPFQIHRRKTEKIRVGHVFLLGDAAHIHSPVGGQGMNTGIQDAFNLAWKLALVIQGDAFQEFLDSYEDERLPAAEQVLKWTTRATKLVTFSQKYLPNFPFHLIQWVQRHFKLKHKVLSSIAELTLSYPQGTYIQESLKFGPPAGYRFPDFHLSDGSRIFDQLSKQNHTLLLFSQQSDFQEHLKKDYGKWIEVRVIEEKQAREHYEASLDCFYLIRPDGYIGYKGCVAFSEHFFRYLDKFFVPHKLKSKLS